jgi:hypothetical protein
VGIRLDGSDDYLAHATARAAFNGEKVTWSIFVRVPTGVTQSQFDRALSVGDFDYDPEDGLNFEFESDDQLRGAVRDAGTAANVAANIALGEDAWVHLIFRSDMSVATGPVSNVRVNGVTAGQITSARGTGAVAVAIGTLLSDLGTFLAQFDVGELACWSSYLTIEQCDALHDGGEGGNGASPSDVDSGHLVSHWRLTDNTDLTDLISGFNLTATGSPASTTHPPVDAPASGDPVLTADAGAFNVTGTTASLERHFTLAAESGAFAWTGTAAELIDSGGNPVLEADGGTFAVTGTAASLERHRTLSAEGGTYAWTGTAATLTYDSVVEGTPGAFTITGTAANLTVGYLISAEAGAFAVAGTAANLEQHRVLQAAGGTFTVTGTDATLTATGAIELVADGGIFAVTGTAAGLFQGYSLDAEAGAFGVAGSVAGLLYGRLLDAEAGAFAWTGTAATLTRAAAFTPIPKYTFGPITMHRILGPQD